MDFGNLFFKFGGRINRAKFWLATLIYAIIYAALFAVGYVSESYAFQAVSGMLDIVILISSIAVGIKRLHDRNKSGLYMLLFYLVPGVLGVAVVMIGMTAQESTTITSALGLLAMAIGIWAFVELGCLRGSIGQNQYGPDPIAPEILTPPVRTH